MHKHYFHMVPYNQKNPFSYVFKFHKADTFRRLAPFLILYCGYAALVAYVGIEYREITETHMLQNIGVMHALLGFAISVLLVFRTNTAYDRWWEGRKLWGELVNSSRSLAMKLDAMLGAGNEEARDFFQKIIPAYALILHDHLHKEKTRTELFTYEKGHKVFKEIAEADHSPNKALGLMHKKIQELYKAGKITGEELLYVNPELISFANICGACERIKNTPIPFAYSVFIKKFIFIYVLTLPFGYVYSLGYIVVPVVAFIFYVLASLELIAEEIEDPFGGDQNDVPTDRLAEKIGKNIAEIW